MAEALRITDADSLLGSVGLNAKTNWLSVAKLTQT
jgi:hypothetical protein